jgi:hypothetical protein
MSARLDWPPTRTDPLLQLLLAWAVCMAVVVTVLLVRAELASPVGHVTVHVDNQAGLPLALEAVERGGGRVAVGTAAPKARTSFAEVVDVGEEWTFVATYAGREVDRQTLPRAELRAHRWTVTIPADATRQLERAGFR